MKLISNEFIEDIEKGFGKYQSFVDAGEQYEDGYIDTLALYLLEGKIENFRSHLEYLNMIGDDADSVIRLDMSGKEVDKQMMDKFSL